MNHNTAKVSYLAIVLACVAAILVSSIWYSPFVFGKQWMELRSAQPPGSADTAMPAWKIPVDLVRELVVVYVLARFVTGLRIVDWKGAVSLGLWVWLGFPVQMLVGCSLWDNKPWTLSLIHAGDWLMKMLLMSLVLSQWPRVSKSLAFRKSSHGRNDTGSNS